MPNVNDISSNLVNALKLAEPGLDTSIGSVARNILDAVASSITEAYNDRQLSNYTYDIDSKSAGDLDDFVALFGMARLQAQRATGVVTFSRAASVAATRTAIIAVGTQINAMGNPVVTAQTTTSVVLPLGQVSLDVPVQVVTAGPQGNVAANTLTSMNQAIDGVTSVTNVSPLVNGTVAEVDSALRTRFRQTVFRNLAGTDQMYRAMALQVQADPTDVNSRAVTQVNVLGSKKTWTEQVQVVSGTATSSVSDAAYIYPSSVYVGPDLTTGNYLTAVSQYTVTINNNVSPATLTISQVGTGMPDGFYDLQFDYVPTYSRNDPLATRFGITGANINNRIDLWVNGLVLDTATQSCVFSTVGGLRFNSTAHDPLQASQYVKLNGATPAVNDIFMPLAFGPIISVPDTIVIGASTYTEGTHYDIVHRNDCFGYAPNSRFGLVWYAGGSLPASNSAFSLVYQYNSVPSIVQQSIETSWRLLGTDVWVHAGKGQKYRLNLVMVYDRGADHTSVNTELTTELSTYFAGLGFNSALLINDVMQVIANVPGVANARFAKLADNAIHYAIEPVNPNGSYGTPISSGPSSGRPVDIYFDDATYPILDSLNIITVGRSNFGFV